MTQSQLWTLRMEIPLCSIFYDDYRNTFGIDHHAVCDFFDGYADYLSELMNQDEHGRGDNHFFEHLSKYDTPDNLWDWYCCLEADPLPLPVCEEKAA